MVQDSLSNGGHKQPIRERDIKMSQHSDTIRWEYKTTREFNIKEAYRIVGNHHMLQSKKKWSKFWNLGLWPKISTFLWFLLKERVVMWENLHKMGMTRPYVCVLFLLVEETMNHLFDECSWTSKFWNKGDKIFKRSNRVLGCSSATIINWEEDPFKSNLLNRIWELSPGFLVWEI